MSKQLAGYRKISNQPLRVYRDSSDTTGIVLCPAHREPFFTLNPAAKGAGEYGGQCEQCSPESAGRHPEAPARSLGSKAQRVRGHLAAGRDYEAAWEYGHALQHYQAALLLATDAEQPAVQEAIDRVAGTMR